MLAIIIRRAQTFLHRSPFVKELLLRHRIYCTHWTILEIKSWSCYFSFTLINEGNEFRKKKINRNGVIRVVKNAQFCPLMIIWINSWLIRVHFSVLLLNLKYLWAESPSARASLNPRTQFSRCSYNSRGKGNFCGEKKRGEYQNNSSPRLSRKSHRITRWSFFSHVIEITLYRLLYATFILRFSSFSYVNLRLLCSASTSKAPWLYNTLGSSSMLGCISILYLPLVMLDGGNWMGKINYRKAWYTVLIGAPQFFTLRSNEPQL